MKAIILIVMMSLYAFANIGTVMAMKGKATIKRSSNIAVKVGMSIKQGDRLTTKSKSRVQIMLKDDSVVTIGANSSFDFSQYQFTRNKNSKLHFKAKKGFFRIVTGKIGKLAPNRFRIKTTKALIGIRGTDFSANIMSHKEIIQCHSGSIWVKIDRGGTKYLDSDMFIEISNKGSTVKKSTSGNPITKEQQNPVDISDVTSDVIKPDQIDKDIQQDRPMVEPNYYNDYPY